jgi:hypothetical protein
MKTSARVAAIKATYLTRRLSRIPRIARRIIAALQSKAAWPQARRLLAHGEKLGRLRLRRGHSRLNLESVTLEHVSEVQADALV